MRSKPLRVVLGALVGMVALLGGTLVSPTDAQVNPFQRGPNPTNAILEAAQGPFAIQSVVVPPQTGFNGGTIYYPTDTSQGTFGAIAVSPGFLSPQAVIQWAGPRIASHGFVVITIDTFTPFDFPSGRATQLMAALNYVATQSTVRSRVDGSRLGVMGHSMGGGGTLEAARDNRSLQAAVALQPWDLFQSFNTVSVPSTIIGAQNDFIAPVTGHSEPFYEQIPAAAEKSYLEVAGADHFLGTQANVTQAKQAIVWYKRYIDNDTRYEQFMCPGPSGSTVVEYRQTCPG